MLKPKHTNTKTVIYQGLEVQIPEDAQWIFLHLARNDVHICTSIEEPEFKKFTWQQKDKTVIMAVDPKQMTIDQIQDSLEHVNGLQLPLPLIGETVPVEEPQVNLREEIFKEQIGHLDTVLAKFSEAAFKAINSDDTPERKYEIVLGPQGYATQLVDKINKLNEVTANRLKEINSEQNEETCDCPVCSAGRKQEEPSQEDVLHFLAELFASKTRH